MPHTVNVQKVTEENFPDISGRPVQTYRFEFRLGEHGPFIERFPVEGFEPNAARMRLEQRARDLELAGLK